MLMVTWQSASDVDADLQRLSDSVVREKGQVWQPLNIGKLPRTPTIRSFLELYVVKCQDIVHKWFAKHYRCYGT